MNESLHPPYGLPDLDVIGREISWAKDFFGIYDIRVGSQEVDGRMALTLKAIFYHWQYGPNGGMELGIFWKEPIDRWHSGWYVRAGDREAPFAPGLHRDFLDVNALNLWNVGESLIDFIPAAIQELGELHVKLSDIMEETISGAHGYVVARLNAAAQRRVKG